VATTLRGKSIPPPTVRDQRLDSGFRTRPYVAGRASASFSAARRNGAPQARRHRSAARARPDVMFDHLLSGGRQIARKVS